MYHILNAFCSNAEKCTLYNRKAGFRCYDKNSSLGHVKIMYLIKKKCMQV